jgi:hypothetical protein
MFDSFTGSAGMALQNHIQQVATDPGQRLQYNREKEMSEKIPGTLVEWLVVWCTQPQARLVRFPDYDEVNISHLRDLVFGYRQAMLDVGGESEYDRFSAWLFSRRPDLKERPTWFGETLVAQDGGNHLEAIAKLRELALEYLEEHPAISRGR